MYVRPSSEKALPEPKRTSGGGGGGGVITAAAKDDDACGIKHNCTLNAAAADNNNNNNNNGGGDDDDGKGEGTCTPAAKTSRVDDDKWSYIISALMARKRSLPAASSRQYRSASS